MKPALHFHIRNTALASSCIAVSAVTASTSAIAADQCIESASIYHQVNAHILTAILMVESRFKPNTITSNSNGTKDFGLGGINTIHLKSLEKYGIDKDNLMDPCVNIYVAAWHLAAKMKQHGNTWFGVASYHSATPYYNQRYQVMLKNALVDLGVIAGPKSKVPPLRPKTQQPAKDSNSPATSSLVVNN